MAMQIRKAERRKAKLRVGLSGPSGSGKTFSAILIAKGIVKGDMSKVGIIDTENGSADLYADMGDFNVIRLEAPYSPERYVEAIRAFEDAGMEAIIIDSVTHEWDGKGGCLELNELLGKTKFKGNNWAAWSETTPRHQKFIEAIVSSKVHVITTARSKTDTIQTEDKKIKKVGLKEIQREGFEYELTLNMTLDRDGHYAVASKDRTGIYDKVDPFLITEEIGKTLIEWAESGAEPLPPSNEEKVRELKKEMSNLLKDLMPEVTLKTADDYKNKVKELCNIDLIEPNLESIVACLLKKKSDRDADVEKTLGEFETKVENKPVEETIAKEVEQAENDLDKALGTEQPATPPTPAPAEETLHDKQPQSEGGKMMKEALEQSKPKDQF